VASKDKLAHQVLMDPLEGKVRKEWLGKEVSLDLLVLLDLQDCAENQEAWVHKDHEGPRERVVSLDYRVHQVCRVNLVRLDHWDRLDHRDHKDREVNLALTAKLDNVENLELKVHKVNAENQDHRAEWDHLV